MAPKFARLLRPSHPPPPSPWGPHVQAAELGIQLYEQNEELTAKLTESQEEVDRLRSLIVDTNQELAAVGDRGSQPLLPSAPCCLPRDLSRTRTL